MKTLVIFSPVIFLFVFTGFITQAQKTDILLLDSKTKESIPFAFVSVESFKGNNKQNLVTDNEGKVSLKLAALSKITISCIGYNNQIDTLSPNTSKTIYLLPAIFSIDEVVVTAQFTPQKVDKSIYRINVITNKQIVQKGANNLSELLANELNIRTTRDAELGSGITLQGLTGNNVKILVDGVPVIGRMGGNIDLSQITLLNVDHIEVVEGPMSVVYGSNALAGAINIITKENTRNTMSASANSYFESIGQYNFNAAFTRTQSKQTISLSGGRNFFNGFSVVDTTRSKLWKPKEQINGAAYYLYKDSKRKLKVQTDFMYETLLDKGNLIAPYFENAFDSYFYTTRLNAKAEYGYLFDHYNLELLVAPSYYSRIKRTFFNDLTTLTKILSENNTDHDTTTFKSAILRGTFSSTLKENVFNYQTGFDVNYEIAYGKRILDNQQGIADYAIFFIGQINPVKKLSLQPGLRFSYNTNFSVPLVPSVNLRWEAASGVQLRLSFARGFRAPSAKELYIYFKDINHDIEPNPDLKSEYGHNFNGSVNLVTEKNSKLHYSEIEINLFYNQMHNIIKLAQRQNGNSIVYNYINVAYYQTSGGNINFKYRFYPNFSITSGIGTTGSYYSFDNQKQGLNDFSYSTDISSALSYTIQNLNTQISLYYKYSGKVLNFDIDENNKITQGYINGYHTLDLSATRHFFSNRLNITFGAKNLFNNTNILSAGAANGGVHTSDSGSSPVGWGRTFFINLNFQFSKF